MAYFEARDYETQNDIERYGRAVAYQRAADYLGALDIFEELLDKDKSVIAYHIGLGQTLVALDQTSEHSDLRASAGTVSTQRPVGHRVWRAPA